MGEYRLECDLITAQQHKQGKDMGKAEIDIDEIRERRNKMGETIIKKVEERYLLSNGGCSIILIVDTQSGRISLLPTKTKYDNKSFTFVGSDPSVVYAIGTLLRDAADSVKLE
jgi:hypothetical protein